MVILVTIIANKILSELPDNIKFKFLIFYSEFRQTGITAYRKNHYNLNNLKNDVKRNMEILFLIEDSEFEKIWKKYIDIFHMSNFDLFETIYEENLSKSLISKNYVLIQNFLTNKIKNMSINDKQILYLYLDLFYFEEIYLFDVSKFRKLYQLIFGELLDSNINNILIKSGLVSETLWISSKGNDLGLHLNKIPFPIDIITNVKNSTLKKITYPSFKKSFKSFKKRFNYKKTRSYFTQCVGIDLLFSGFDQIDDGLKLIDTRGIMGLLAHPNIIDKNIFNSFLKEELWEFILEAAKYLQSKYNWVNMIFNNISKFSFLEDSTDFYRIYNHEIEEKQYHIIISCWYRYSLPIEQNSILILLYHPNVGSLINKIYDPETTTSVIAFDENENIIIVGEECTNDLINSIEDELKERNYNIKKKILSKEEIKESDHKSLEIEPDIQKKILDLLEKHDTEVNEKFNYIINQLKEKLGSDYQKLKKLRQEYKNKEISRGKYIKEVGKIIGKHAPLILRIFF